MLSTSGRELTGAKKYEKKQELMFPTSSREDVGVKNYEKK